MDKKLQESQLISNIKSGISQQEKINSDFKIQLFILEQALQQKQKQVENLTLELGEEKRLRKLTETNVTKLRQFVIQLQKEFTGIVETSNYNSDKIENNKDTKSYDPIKTLNQISNNCHQKLDKYFAEKEQLKLEIRGINKLLEMLGGASTPTRNIVTLAPPIILSPTITSPEVINVSDNDSGIVGLALSKMDENLPKKRISKKTCRLVDELIHQQTLNDENKTKKKISDCPPKSANLTHGLDKSQPNSQLFSCLCSKTFKKRSALMEHIRYHTSEWMFACYMCEMRFRGVSYLKKHLTDAHKLELDDEFKNLVGCRECGGLFQTWKELTQHKIKEHKPITENDDEAVVGKVAGKKRKINRPHVQKKNVAKKSMSHGKDDSKIKLGFFCLCGKKFRTLKLRQQHVQYFNSEKKFSCRICGDKFVGANYLRRHIIKKHNYRPGHYRPSLGCRKCGKLCATRSRLLQHQRLKHSEAKKVIDQESPLRK